MHGAPVSFTASVLSGAYPSFWPEAHPKGAMRKCEPKIFLARPIKALS